MQSWSVREEMHLWCEYVPRRDVYGHQCDYVPRRDVYGVNLHNQEHSRSSEGAFHTRRSGKGRFFDLCPWCQCHVRTSQGRKGCNWMEEVGLWLLRCHWQWTGRWKWLRTMGFPEHNVRFMRRQGFFEEKWLMTVHVMKKLRYMKARARCNIVGNPIKYTQMTPGICIWRLKNQAHWKRFGSIRNPHSAWLF